MTLKQKIEQYRQLKALLPQLEREIRDEGTTTLGLKVKPRLERILDQFSV